MIKFVPGFLLFVSIATPLRAQTADTNPAKTTELAQWRKECFSDQNMGSCTLLANALSTNKDDPERQKALMRLCDASDGASCMQLGRAAEKANAMEDATVWYRKACNLGIERGQGCVALAKLAATQKNEKNAKIWLRKACAQGDKPSCKLVK